MNKTQLIHIHTEMTVGRNTIFYRIESTPCPQNCGSFGIHKVPGGLTLVPESFREGSMLKLLSEEEESKLKTHLVKAGFQCPAPSSRKKGVV